jgi:hypothetical protein
MATDATKAAGWVGGAALLGFLAVLFWPKKAVAAAAPADQSGGAPPDQGGGVPMGGSSFVPVTPTSSTGSVPTCNPGDPCETAFPTGLSDREAYILERVQAGDYYHTWSEVSATYNGHTAVFQVSSDALKVHGVRVEVTARLQQQLADVLGASLLTALVSDVAFLEAQIYMPPQPNATWVANGTMASTAHMIDQSRKLDQAIINGFGSLDAVAGALVCDPGKDWIIDNGLATHPGKACNYGWHFHGSSNNGISGEVCASGVTDPATGAPLRMIQGRGFVHNDGHTDYSQYARFLSTTVVVDGQAMALADVLSSPDLAPLANHSGVLTVLRQPGV